jgi:hypothetical protein
MLCLGVGVALASRCNPTTDFYVWGGRLLIPPSKNNRCAARLT